MNFQDKVIVITGATGNLGRAVAAAFSGKGAHVVLLALREDELSRTFGDSTPKQTLIATDLTDKSQVHAAIEKVRLRWGRVDVLCNLTGGFLMGAAVHEALTEDWEYLFSVNVRTLLNMVEKVVPIMKERSSGKIINVGALSASRGMASMGPYISSKSVVARLTESMAAELGGHGINVNCVLPSIIDTPENRSAMPDGNPGTWVNPSDVAAVITFLASEDSRAIQGVSLPVSGLIAPH